MARRNEAQPIVIKQVVPPDIDPVRRLQILEQIHTLQSEYAEGTQNKQKICLEIPRPNPERPLIIVSLSDLHLGHRAVDLPKLKEMLNWILSNPDVYVILTGDEIEGFSPKHFNTSLGETPFNLRAQIDFFKLLVLAPLLMKHKVLTMVGTYWAHVEWHADDTTLNMQEILTAVDMQDILGFMAEENNSTDVCAKAAQIQQQIPIIENGGILELSIGDQDPVTIEVLHNPKGRNKVDALHGIRENAMQNLRAGSPADVTLGAHIHAAGTGVEIVDEDTRFTLVQAGTIKGVKSGGVKDLYGVKCTFGMPDLLDQSILVIPSHNQKNGQDTSRGKKPQLVPMISGARTDLLYSSLLFRDAAAAAHNDAELRQLIEAKEPKPNIIIDPCRSKQLISEEQRIFSGILGAEKKYVQPYSALAYTVDTQLPLLFYPIGNARVGSGAEDEDAFYGFFDTAIANNPHAVFVLLRSLIDPGLGKVPARREHLNTLAENLSPYSSQGLALMLSETLRQDSWKRVIGEGDEGVPIAPGTYLSELLAIPLVNQLAVLELGIQQNNPYRIRLVDRPMQFTASGKPTRGLMTIENRMLGRNRPDAVVSASNTHQVGIASIPSARGAVDFVASGYTATEVASGPSKHISPVESIGQGIIITVDKRTGEYVTIPTPSRTESEDFFDAVLLFKGAELLGVTDKMKRKKRTKSK